MKVTTISDIHLEFGPCELPGGEILILAGDICVARSLLNRQSIPRAVRDFFEVECAKYQQVLYLPGNHESYHGVFEDTVDILKNWVPDNVIVLDRGHWIHGDTVFVLATLWTDLNKNNPITAMRVRDCMNDFHCIRTAAGGKFTPARALQEHELSLAYIAQCAAEYPDKTLVVATHHAPSNQSTAERFRDQFHENAGYHSNLEQFILDRPNIRYHLHGHMHNFSDYHIGGCRVVCNPRGYLGHEARALEFDAGFGFDV
jgi:hypothetical protein